MDAQYPFASREDIWRVQEEVKDLFAAQLEHGERISRLERRRDDDARMKSVWGPLSPFPGSIGTVHHQETSFNPTAEPFKGFDQTHQHGLTGALHLENEEEPRRGASRANSVRFDESSMYYSQANRSTAELLPLRTGSGLGSHPLTERSLSHRSDGKQSSSGQSHHSARTNSMGLEASRLLGGGNGTSSASNTPLPPPPGLFILGPVPCIIRCWLTTNFSNDSLLYAAVCTGSYRSAISEQMVRKLGLEEEAAEEDGVRIIKLPVYLPEASVYQPSSRGGSPVPQLPALTVRFIIRGADLSDKSIQIFLGSDVLRAHNADILFSQDKMLIVDDGRNKISIPLVRPEDDSTFRYLTTGPEDLSTLYNGTTSDKRTGLVVTNGDQPTTECELPTSAGHDNITTSDKADTSTNLGARASSDSFDRKPIRSSARHFTDDSSDNNSPDQRHYPKPSAGDRAFTGTSTSSAKAEGSGVWGPWRRDTTGDKGENTGATGTTTSTSASMYSSTTSPFMSAYQRSTRTRNMKILKPTKSTSSVNTVSRQASSSGVGTPTTTTTTATGTASSGFGSDSRFPPVDQHRTGTSTSTSCDGHDQMTTSSSQHAQQSVNGAGAGKPSSSDGGGGTAGPWSGKSRTANPVGGASAFGWLNSSQRRKDGMGSE
ncbi:uncharacterized protein BDCG_00113 [Blastomyces dermatitidis ER-3]|uniref:Ubiquitin carboxyl-terminal hydrolase 19 n=1 Tax=Ajellomyces dermatitidis (strain ER-3 / ATCC MYA-2586) TaxID=559297 RepID=A0ABP2EJP8_AJEDR|nr:uncharacterized protein BDCG_00113 [Blastomyces dermatitidis ER-3]EEQ83308.1 hypothetical protein BDCG_00113 [Blastomyces dermatitidis ER-3]